jgi:hypothetical protein
MIIDVIKKVFVGFLVLLLIAVVFTGIFYLCKTFPILVVIFWVFILLSIIVGIAYSIGKEILE